MAAPTLDGTNTYNTTGTALADHTIPLPATGMAAGKRIVVFFGMSGSQTTTITSTDPDWTFYGSGDALYSCNAVASLRLATKVAGASEPDPTFTMSQTVHASVISSVWGHADGTPTIDEVAAYDNGDVGSQGSIPAPSVTTLGPDRAVVRAADMNGSLAITYAASTAQASCISSGTVRQTSFGVLNQAVEGATGTETISGGNATWVATTMAIAPPDVTPPTTETLLPTAATFTNLSGTVATIDEGLPGGGDWATGTDPSGTTGSSNNQYAAASAAASGLANQLTSPANAVGSSEASTSATTGATQNTDYANFFTFSAAALASAIPSNATITGFTVRLRDALSTLARGDVGVRVDSTNGTQIAAEDVAKTGLTTALPAAGTGVHTSTPATLPTRAQIVASTFGVRVRYRRTASQAATYTLDWLRLEISYSVPGSTVNTEVRATMADPVATLATGTGTGTARARVRKLGSGSDPSVSLLIKNAAGTTLATALGATAVSSTTGVDVEGTFDQSVITNPTDVVIWVVGTGAAGGLVEVDAVDWVAQVAAGPSPTTVNLGALSLAATQPAPTLTPGAVSLTLPALSAAISQPTATVQSTVTTQLAALTLAASQPAPTVTPGAVSLTLAALSAVASQPAPTVTPGAVTQNLAALSATLSQPTATASTTTPGQTANVAALTLAATNPAPTLTPGAVTVSLGALTLAGSTPTPTVVPGATTVNLAALSASATQPAPTVVPGAATVNLAALSGVFAAPAPSTAGATTVTLGALTLAGSTPAPTVQSTVTTQLVALTLTGTAPTPTVVPGARTVTLAALSGTFTAPAPVASGGIVVNLAALSAATSQPALTVVPGARTTTLAALSGVFTAPAPVASTGGAPQTVSLAALTLAASQPALVVQPGARSIALAALGLSGILASPTVVPGAVIIPLPANTLAGNIGPVTFQGAVDVPLGALVASGVVPLAQAAGGPVQEILAALLGSLELVDASAAAFAGETPVARTYVVTHENRAYLVAVENRELLIAPEDRKHLIAPEDRRLVVPARSQ